MISEQCETKIQNTPNVKRTSLQKHTDLAMRQTNTTQQHRSVQARCQHTSARARCQCTRGKSAIIGIGAIAIGVRGTGRRAKAIAIEKDALDQHAHAIVQHEAGLVRD
jgi:hypothetical protein